MDSCIGYGGLYVGVHVQVMGGWTPGRWKQGVLVHFDVLWAFIAKSMQIFDFCLRFEGPCVAGDGGLDARQMEAGRACAL